jgi:hypothetical protein
MDFEELYEKWENEIPDEIAKDRDAVAAYNDYAFIRGFHKGSHEEAMAYVVKMNAKFGKPSEAKPQPVDEAALRRAEDLHRTATGAGYLREG